MTNSVAEIPSELKRVIDVEEEKDKKLVQFANKRKVVMLAIIASYVPARVSPARTESAYVGISEEFGVETVLSQICARPEDSSIPTYLLVNSSGGAVSSSYKTAKAIRDCFKKITVFIPHIALSGGTLLALTGNEIMMGTMSQLSSLDVQIVYKDTLVSANALLRAKGKLDKYFAETRVEDAPYTMKTMADSLDPTIMEEWTGAQETAVDYVHEILQKSGYRNAKSIARKLVYELTTHGYVIGYEKAKKVGLKVIPHTCDLEAWQMMRYWLGKYMIKAADRHFIRCIMPSQKETVQKEK